jgi:hypothetical protein
MPRLRPCPQQQADLVYSQGRALLHLAVCGGSELYSDPSMKAQFRSTYKAVSAARALTRRTGAGARPAQLNFRLAENEDNVLDLTARCEGEYRLACRTCWCW